jgi:hypothetical protein
MKPVKPLALVSLSFTTYFFTAICFAVANHLRRYGNIDSEIDREINDAGY